MRVRRAVPVVVAAVAMVVAGCTSGDDAGDEVVTVTSQHTLQPGESDGSSAGSGETGTADTGGTADAQSPDTSGAQGGDESTGGSGTDGSGPAPSSPASSPASSPESTPASTPKKTTTGAKPTKPADGRPESNVPMTKLKQGDKPPQFVIFSFDGAGSHDKWGVFSEAAAATDSRFTGFLSGIYLVTSEHADAYTGPGHNPGAASIGFGGTAEEVITEVKDLNRAYAAGHEIGTHYNGHFCEGNDPSGNDWSTADWNSELDQFFTFMKDWKNINDLPDAPELTVPTDEVKGGRTPCLEGEWEQMAPAWKKHGMTYDSSLPAPYTGLAWPEKKDGIWEFHMPTVYSPGFKDNVMAMDYNFWYKFNGAAEQPETAPELRQIVRQTYDYMYNQAHDGNRAPVLIANHFNDWNGNSFNQPALEFMKDTCGNPDTYCATYSDVIAWMEMQDPAVLQQWLDKAPVATGN